MTSYRYWPGPALDCASFGQLFKTEDAKLGRRAVLIANRSTNNLALYKFGRHIKQIAEALNLKLPYQAIQRN